MSRRPPAAGMDAEQQEQLRREYLDSVDRVGPEEAGDAFRKGGAKVSSLDGRVPGQLRALWDDLKTMLAMLGDYLGGRYRDVPWRIIAAIAGALLYFASPLDLIPDFIPLVGYLDDAFVIGLALDLVRGDLQAYRRWRQQRDKQNISGENP